MTESGPSRTERRAAGEFSSWMSEIEAAIRGGGDSDVPCAGCTACCTASQFVHIGPEEGETLSRIPKELVFSAPRLPPGHVLLGYDDTGRCPMLADGGCSIYEHRPTTCRTYDCRVFAAAGVAADTEDETKALIARRAEEWEFTYASDDSRDQHAAVRAAAAFLRAHPDLVPAAEVPANATQLAVLAVEIHDAFLRHREPDPDAVTAAFERLSTPGREPPGATGG